MTVKELYQSIFQNLQTDAQDPTSRAFDLSCLLEAVFGFDRFALLHAGEKQADPAQSERFRSLTARYAAGEPLQYLLGQWEFYGLPFVVGEGVLIPRPDTETLVEVALNVLHPLSTPTVADLCSGSGCVAIALAKHHPTAQVYALELSESALPYLRRNVELNQTDNVTVLPRDVLIPPELPPLDLIVSNPPYITGAEMTELSPVVRHEPELALFGGADGLRFYRAIPKLYHNHLKPNGTLAFEVGWQQAAAVAELLAASGYHDIAIQKDLGGMERVVSARKSAQPTA